MLHVCEILLEECRQILTAVNDICVKRGVKHFRRVAAEAGRNVMRHRAWRRRTPRKKTGLRTRSATSVYDGRIKFPLGWHASMNEGGTCRRNGSQSTGRGNERLRKRPALRANAKRYLSGFRHRQSPDNNDDDLHGARAMM